MTSRSPGRPKVTTRGHTTKHEFNVPRFLFVICVPDNNQHYAALMTDGVILRHLGYFISLRSEQPIANPDRNKRRTVRVPTANVLTTAALRRLTERQSVW